jgi:alpha-beta hydrolase superfamily lysophospholipase
LRLIPTTGRPRAVALVLHGLNMKPERMEGVCDALARKGVECWLATLTGHGGDLEALRSVRRETFLEDAGRACETADRRARELGVPLLLAACSLGAVVGNDLLHERDGVRLAGMVLFAPAFTPRRFARVARWLSPFPRLVIPSASPEAFRANRGTSVAAYRALFDSIAALEARGYARSNVPAVVFVDPKDELVSLRELRRLVARRGLDRWKIVEVSNAGSMLERSVHHLITGPEELGSEEWSRVEAQIGKFLDGLPGIGPR